MLLLHKCLIAAIFLLAVSVVSFASAKSPAGADSAPSRFKVVWKEGRLSVNAERASLSQVLGEIAKQTGIEIRGGEVLKRKVSAKFSSVSLRKGLHELLGPLNYALLEKGPSGGRGPITPFALVVLPQGFSTSTQIKSKPKPAVIVSNDVGAISDTAQATTLTQGGTQPQENQAAAATTSDDAAQPGDDHAADALTSEGNPGDGQAAQLGATQEGVNGTAPEMPPPALPDKGVNVTATNRSAPAMIPDEGIAMGSSRSGPVPILDDGVNLELQQSQGGGVPEGK
ncbi:MAG: hypothetical protein ACLQU2_09875 [Candidatus Binataceae bacterium]